MPRFILAAAAICLALLAFVVFRYLLPGNSGPNGDAAAFTRPKLVLDPTVIASEPRVKLAVMVVIDQLRGDYLPRWRSHLPAGGFRRLMEDGAWYSNCRYPYATTSTGPGHASMLTGAVPAKHGIIDNEWYDRAAGSMVYCATAPGFDFVRQAGPIDPNTARQERVRRRGAGTPARMTSPTVGDQLKASGRGGKVIGLSLKDRGAILPAGAHADAAYWFDGEFVTTTYYRNDLPEWVRKFNAAKPHHRWFGQNWDRLRPDLDYAAIAGPDNAPGEANRAGLGTTFPHPVTGGKDRITEAYYEALTTSPFADDLLLEFARECIIAEKLGTGPAPDLLAISFSAFDYLGHAFGPDSQEVFDALLRADRRMAELLTFLDEQIGVGRYSLVLCSDHGVAPLVEASRARNIPAVKVVPDKLREEMDQFLTSKYGAPRSTRPEADDPYAGLLNRWIEAFEPPNVYINRAVAAESGRSIGDVARELAGWLRQRPEVERVYTITEQQDAPAKDDIDRMVRRSFHPDRSGDLYVLLKPYSFFAKAKYEGTLHGTPYDYDRHVPLLVFGPGSAKGERTEPMVPQMAAVILSEHLGLKPPRDAILSWPQD